MSLSFVSKSVLTAKEGGDGYEETPIEPKEGQQGTGSSSSAYTTAKPLFEQLRANKEQEEMEREEFQKSIMRGTLALDEEDCAHLDAVQKQRQEREQMIQRETQSELEAFRAAQAVSRIEQGMKHDDDDDYDDDNGGIAASKPATKNEKQPAKTNNKQIFPKIIVKKRKQATSTDNANDKKKKDAALLSDAKKPNQDSSSAASAVTKNSDEKAKPATKPSLAGLLEGYGSDSDSD